MDREEVIQTLKQNNARFQHHGIERLAIFGSTAVGDTRPDSDLDILVRFKPAEKSFDNFMEVRFLLEELFPGVTIDLVLENALKPAIRERILSQARDVA